MQYLEHVIVVFVERILVACCFHPSEDERTAARDDVHQTPRLFERFDHAPVHACMDGHEIHAVFSVTAHHIKEVLRRDGDERLL